MTTAYSYIRFSTPEQSKGDSLRRQTEATARYCKEHGLRLDTDLDMQDAGLSGYHGRNVRDGGALAGFLDAVRTGLVPAGSVLLVEHLDRLSRMRPRKAMRLLEEIVEAGVDVVTLNDGRRYTDDNLDNLDSLLISMMAFSLAHEESKKKAARLRDAWGEKRKQLKNGTIMTSKVKTWLRVTNGKPEVIPARAKIIQSIFADYLSGKGIGVIARDLNKRGVPTGTFGPKDKVTGERKPAIWRDTRIARLLDDPAVTGVLIVKETSHDKEGRRILTEVDRVPDYYPAIVSPEDFARVKLLREAKASMTGKNAAGRMKNIFANLIRCSRCGSGVVRTTKASGSPGNRTYYPVYVCSKARQGGDCMYESITCERVEEALMGDLSRLIDEAPKGIDADVLDAQMEGLWDRSLSTQQAIETLMDILEKGDKSVLARIRSLEAKLQPLKAQHAALVDQRDLMSNKLVVARCKLLADAAKAGDIPGMNRGLRLLCSGVVLDLDQRVLRFQWRHGGEDHVALDPIDFLG
jgi:DNA invertase Pin-like site-specific DNA recombinase